MTMGVWSPAGELAQWRLPAQSRQVAVAEQWARPCAAQPRRVWWLFEALVAKGWIPAPRDQQRVLACCQRLKPQTMPRARMDQTQTNTIPHPRQREPPVPP